ncbi:MAG TPA: PKD domain-containing protein [Candidatus Thermoplasmatota archaeon]|nr:PKD domain-containing protein [Candidatus Thermoplasmatota archaeon]
MKNTHKLIAAVLTSNLFLVAFMSVQAVDVSITDPTGDVATVDYNTGESTYVTTNPYININDIDITKLTYTKAGGFVTLTMEVKGGIENQGNINDLTGEGPSMNQSLISTIMYSMTFDTKLAGSIGGSYIVDYVNKTCQLTTDASGTPVNLTSKDFSVSGNTFSVTIPLDNSDEMYGHLNGTTYFLRININGSYSDLPSMYTLLSDVAPNQPLEITYATAQSVGSVKESIQFNSSVTPFTGQPPFTYEWKFGDGTTSSQQNPTHAYTKAGTYEYNLTVIDQASSKAYYSGSIEIVSEGGGGGASSPLLVFLAVIIVIAAIGIVVLVMIIRRR